MSAGLDVHIALKTAQCIAFKRTEKCCTALIGLALYIEKYHGGTIPFEPLSSADFQKLTPRTDLWKTASGDPYRRAN